VEWGKADDPIKRSLDCRKEAGGLDSKKCRDGPFLCELDVFFANLVMGTSVIALNVMCVEEVCSGHVSQ
jgi:hypothetical protein